VGAAGAPGLRRGEPTRREALAALLAAWALVPALGALPFLGVGVLGPLDAYFESMSGFTTTGATVLTDFSAVGPVLFMWRAFTQWIGGIGIIVLFVGLFPQLAIAGRQLFFAEAPGPTEERLTPRLRHTAFALLGVYAALTLACARRLRLAGMTTYDAFAHAFTTMSAGGFSPHARSFEVFAPALMWVAALFMLFAGSNFALLYRGFAGRAWSILRDVELRAYLAVAATVTVALAALLSADGLRGRCRLAARDLPGALGPHLHGLRLGRLRPGPSAARRSCWSSPSSAAPPARRPAASRWRGGSSSCSTRPARSVAPSTRAPCCRSGWVGASSRGRPALRGRLHHALRRAVRRRHRRPGPARRGLHHRLLRRHRLPGQHRPGPRRRRADGELRRLHPLAKGLLTFCMYAGRLEVVTVFVLATRGWWRKPRFERGFG
jgi:hypothetical protein